MPPFQNNKNSLIICMHNVAILINTLRTRQYIFTNSILTIKNIFDFIKYKISSLISKSNNNHNNRRLSQPFLHILQTWFSESMVITNVFQRRRKKLTTLSCQYFSKLVVLNNNLFQKDSLRYKKNIQSFWVATQ